ARAERRLHVMSVVAESHSLDVALEAHRHPPANRITAKVEARHWKQPRFGLGRRNLQRDTAERSCRIESNHAREQSRMYAFSADHVVLVTCIDIVQLGL